MQEAKDSSEIENIITTHDEPYLADVNKEKISREVKEVQNYKETLLFGYENVKAKGIITLNDIVQIQKIRYKAEKCVAKIISKLRYYGI